MMLDSKTRGPHMRAPGADGHALLADHGQAVLDQGDVRGGAAHVDDQRRLAPGCVDAEQGRGRRAAGHGGRRIADSILQVHALAPLPVAPR